jgi:pimeloyl-ACP methyl ester carboxylesterase
MQVDFKPRNPRTGRRAVILAHADDASYESSGSAQWIDPVNYPCSSAIAAQLASTGFICSAADFGGTQNFGADPCALDVYTTWQTLVANYGAASDKVVIIATSMGFCTAFQFARKYPGKVAAIAGVVPAVSLTDIYLNDRVGVRSAVAAAWNIAYPATLPTISDPTLNPGVYSNIAVKLYYSTADTAVIPATVTTFAALTGATTEVISTTLPHGDSAIGATPFPDLAQFLVANGA